MPMPMPGCSSRKTSPTPAAIEAEQRGNWRASLRTATRARRRCCIGLPHVGGGKRSPEQAGQRSLRVLKRILIGLAVIVIVVLGFAATRADTYSVERKISIAAPAEIVIAQLDDFHA